MEAVIRANLPDTIPEDQRDTVAAAADAMGMPALIALVQAGQKAAEQKRAGDIEGARLTIEPYRLMAEQAGLGALFDATFNDLGSE